ncbi:hypothetical protein GE21DRAFT_4178 [Neurospora crassa]|uniref:Cell wall biogenesis protein Ecm15 n=1 Tax=Neurospora crassa (strain ATCC 24698 / 74-OR23-1A / CBS 708.71 / DSM 1257 / FGSC 987) TaxID=367110 RepID=U9W4M3_NEUCR|nr:cell wall biogenesis protein Ecm15 [Neurospora crassa OR74A]ESA43199.1 cell wall biogenesis protein Ecm15 [Neurospora crassa OR74A]KHE87028.1 hypothetical protein GE21DRAFT_4178 [Neurospora crassa]|eukprot:XP_011393883.1 cell wall biogenesis protein Ecm15 [Neurospora crassa OR74A]
MSLFRPAHHRSLLNHTSRLLQKPHQITIKHPSYLKMSFRDYSNIETPASCYVDFCLIPVGTGNVSVAKEVAEVQRVLAASGLKSTMHSAGTTVEGSWDEVMKVIGQVHAVVHQGGVKRVQTSMRVGTRIDKKQTAEDKVKRVQAILSEDQKGESSA